MVDGSAAPASGVRGDVLPAADPRVRLRALLDERRALLARLEVLTREEAELLSAPVAGSTGAAREHDLAARVLEAVTAIGRPARAFQIEARLGVDRRKVANALHELSKRGKVIRKSKGLYELPSAPPAPSAEVAS